MCIFYCYPLGVHFLLWDQLLGVGDVNGELSHALESASRPQLHEHMQKFSKIGAENFPESVGITFVINTSYFFRMCWAAVTPFVPTNTLAKFHILGSDFQSVLHEHVRCLEMIYSSILEAALIYVYRYVFMYIFISCLLYRKPI